eukprot:1169643-Pyramimonas_sp.AAC.1
MSVSSPTTAPEGGGAGGAGAGGRRALFAGGFSNSGAYLPNTGVTVSPPVAPIGMRLSQRTTDCLHAVFA